jgi:predicted Zn-dependent protease with MMP-like domain
MNSRYDYLNIGCAGFAQLGKPDYSAKASVEMRVCEEFIEKAHPVPEAFNGIAWITSKSFDHDFGRYREIVIIYDRDLVETWNDEDDEAYDMDKHIAFWEWANACEGFDFDNQDLSARIATEYFESLDLDKGEHLQLLKAAS